MTGVVTVLALGSALGAVARGVEPTGVGGVDVLLAAAFGALGVAAAVASPPGPLAFAAAMTTGWSLVAGSPWALGASVTAFALAATSPRWRGRRRVVRAATGVLLVQAVLGLDGGQFTGDTALVGGVATIVVLAGAMAGMGRRTRRVALLAAGTVLVLALAASAGAAIAVLDARSDVDAAVSAIEEGLDAMRAADQEAAVVLLGDAARRFDQAQSRLHSWWARGGRAVPVVAQNYDAVEALTGIGSDLAWAGVTAAQAADPDAARLEDGRIDLKAVAALEEPLDGTVGALESARARASVVGSPWLFGPLGDARRELVERVEEALPEARRAVDAARFAPGLLGADGPRRYFVAFVTPAEARASGGIVGNYAELLVTGGRVEMTAFGRNSDLNRAGDPESRELIGPPDYLARYGHLNIHRWWQDVTFSPDFPSVAQVIEGLYPQSGGRAVDGVISVDPEALAALLDLTGPVQVPEIAEPVTAENAPGLLLREQYVRFADDNAERIDFLESVARAVFEKLTTGALPGPGRVGDVLGPMVREGRLKMHSVHPEEQAFLDSVDLSGRYPPVRGHFVGVVTQNGSLAKLDVFLRREVRYEAVVDPATGQTDAMVEITLHNDAPSEGLPRYVLGGAIVPPGDNLAYLSVYTPLRLVGAEVDGQALPMQEETELERWVNSAYVTVPAGETVTVRVRLAGTIATVIDDGATRLRVDIARQALVFPDDVEVLIRLTPGWQDDATGRDEITRRLDLDEDAVIEATLVRGR